MGGEAVTVVIPTYHRNGRLAEAIDSVLCQTHDRVDIIVVDDSGVANARPVADRYDRVTYLAHDANKGANAARSLGAELASGEYVQFLDDDDRLREDKLEKQTALLSDRDDCGVAYCGIRWETGEVRLPASGAQGDVLGEALRFELHTCANSSMLIEREPLEDVLPLSNRPGADDIGLRIELARRTEFAFVDEPLVVKGVTDRRRGRSWGALEGRRDILREYADLYREFPPAVWQSATAYTHRFAGNRYLDEAGWSAAAIRAYARAARRRPDGVGKSVGRLVAAVGGRPGMWAARRLWQGLAG